MRIGDSVWHAKRKYIPNAEIAEFEKPTEIRTRCNFLTVMPLTSRGYAEVMKYGEDIDNTWTVIANDRAFHDKIHIGDLFWVDGDNPISELELEYGNGSSATAVVKSVDYVNFSIAITLTRNKEQIKR